MESISSFSDNNERMIDKFYITRRQARDFIRRYIPDESLWKELSDDWGGHLHRAVLSIAKEIGDDDERVDVLQRYVVVFVADPNPRWGMSPDEAMRHAEYLASSNATRAFERYINDDETTYIARSTRAIDELKGVFGYSR
jgi:hypothetical protein